MKKKNLFLTSILLIFIYSCGFKIADQSAFKNYEIKEIEFSGNKQINFKLKNKILSNIKKGKEKLITLELNSKKIKSVKEKNIKNEITKYELVITIETKYFILDTNKKNTFYNTVKGNYNVSTTYADTLKNEKNLINLLTEKVSSEITRKLATELNDI